MHLVSHALAWVRALLFGPPECGRGTRCTGPEAGRTTPVPYPSPGMWGATLAAARRRRAPHLWPSPELPAIEDDSINDALVRAYVLHEDEQTLCLASPLRRAW
ncbi:hypothetical protein [Streptomyces ipomoeae]|nr:hypothetical protein [Streptomyces ipomoeae]TQE27842.1 hypothetical protein Sipo7851_31785 [Streptomyces ipomoeae]